MTLVRTLLSAPFHTAGPSASHTRHSAARGTPRATRASAAALVAACGATVAFGDVEGFDFLQNWEYNENDNSAPPSFVNGDGDFVKLTSGGSNDRSFWYLTKQNISEFEASFTCKVTDLVACCGVWQGLTFTVQNSPAGASALGGYANGLGYSGIPKSVAVAIRVYGSTEVTVGINGVIPDDSDPVAPVSLANGADVQVSISYSGSLLTVDLSQGASVSPTFYYFVGSIPTILGSDTGYVGFTAGTYSGAHFYCTDFSFTNDVSPCPADLTGNGAVDGSDLGLLLAQWGGAGSADLNGSGVVDGADLGELLSAWGVCG